MNTNTRIKEVLLTHRNCPDGAAAAVVLRTLQPNAYVGFATHDSVGKEALRHMEGLQAGERMFIADIAPGFGALNKLMRLAAEKQVFLGIYDHHETMKWLKDIETKENKYVEIIFDETRCGSKILFDSITKLHADFYTDVDSLKPYEEFIRVTNDRDLWLQQEEQSEALAMLHNVLGDEDYMQRFLENPNIGFSDKEKTILEYVAGQKKKNEDRLLKRMRVAYDSQCFKYGAMYGEAQSSDLLNRAIEEHSLEYAFLINLNTKKVSMRSRGKMNCASFAEHYKGGGHVRASGFRLNFKEPLL